VFVDAMNSSSRGLHGFLPEGSDVWLWHCATRLSPREGNREAHDSMNSLHLQTLKTLLGSLALLRVLKDKEIQRRARAIGDMCKTTEGRVVAHDQIVQSLYPLVHEAEPKTAPIRLSSVLHCDFHVVQCLALEICARRRKDA
jgi:hypothetical protein